MSTASPPHSAPRDLRFAWRAVDTSGARKSGTVMAPDAGVARAMLKRDNLFAYELVMRGEPHRQKARAAEVTLFTRQLASLLRAGLPLAPALDLLAQSS